MSPCPLLCRTPQSSAAGFVLAGARVSLRTTPHERPNGNPAAAASAHRGGLLPHGRGRRAVSRRSISPSSRASRWVAASCVIGAPRAANIATATKLRPAPCRSRRWPAKVRLVRGVSLAGLFWVARARASPLSPSGDRRNARICRDSRSPSAGSVAARRQFCAPAPPVRPRKSQQRRGLRRLCDHWHVSCSLRARTFEARTLRPGS